MLLLCLLITYTEVKYTERLHCRFRQKIRKKTSISIATVTFYFSERLCNFPKTQNPPHSIQNDSAINSVVLF